MSQAGLIDIEASNPQIPTSFTTDSGTAVPISNNLEILGSSGVETSASGKTITISLTGGGQAIDTVLTDSGLPAVVPDADGQISILGSGDVSVTGNGPGNTVTVALTADYGETITGDNFVALSPDAGGNWNINGGNGIDTFGAGNTLIINATGGFASYTATAVSYSVTSTDVIIGVTSTAAARTITLPPAAIAGQWWIIKDESGGAATNNITVSASPKTIDGVASKAITTNYGSYSVYYNGTNYFLF